MIAIGLVATMTFACSGDDSTTQASATEATTNEATGETSTSTTEGTTDGTATEATTEATTMADTAADGDPCQANEDCLSASCLKFNDNDPAAACSPGPDGGNTRFTGTIYDFSTGSTLAAELRVIGALAALGDPSTAEPLVQGNSDTMGVFDFTTASPISAGIGIIGLVVLDNYYLTATGLASPVTGSSYGPLNTIHDVWAVPTKDLTAWSDILAMDAELMAVDPPVLPLGDAGGVVGLVRAKGSGAPVAGAKIVGKGGSTGALIRYLNEAKDGFTSDMTSSNGIFILVKPGLAEEFTVDIGGTIHDEAVNKAGSAPGAAFTMILNVVQ
ncbi:MAG: hypothetical protein R3B09_15150 [Nannocystaceae bacterium]